jgi:hypothetical protein
MFKKRNSVVNKSVKFNSDDTGHRQREREEILVRKHRKKKIKALTRTGVETHTHTQRLVQRVSGFNSD